MSLLGWLGAALIGISLGLFGSGGSIVTVPVLTVLFGQAAKVAVAGSLFVVGCVALLSSLPGLWRGAVDGRAVLLFGVPGMAGTWIGAWSAHFIPGAAQLVLFGVVVLVAAALLLRPPAVQPPPRAPRPVPLVMADGLVVGIVTGLVGVGGGFLIVPALVLLGGLPMHRALATSLVIIAMKSLTGFIGYLDVLDARGLALDWPVLMAVTGVAALGGLLGGRVATVLPAHRLQRGFAVFLCGMAVFVLVRAAPGLV